MNTKRATLLLFLLCTIATDVASQNPSLTVVIHGIKNSKGKVRVALYNSEKDFMKTLWQSKDSKATPNYLQIVFENIPAGTYAISIVHDSNDNGKLDSNAMGIPKEGFGFSNNAIATFGPPSFAQAKFDWDGQMKMEITLLYF